MAATLNAFADLLNTALDRAYHPTRYGNSAMLEERLAQLNRIQALQRSGYYANDRFREYQQNQRAKRYLSTIEENKNNWLARGGNLEDFYKKQREAIINHNDFQNLTQEEKNHILKEFNSKATADGYGMYISGEVERGNQLGVDTAGYGYASKDNPRNIVANNIFANTSPVDLQVQPTPDVGEAATFNVPAPATQPATQSGTGAVSTDGQQPNALGNYRNAVKVVSNASNTNNAGSADNVQQVQIPNTVVQQPNGVVMLQQAIDAVAKKNQAMYNYTGIMPTITPLNYNVTPQDTTTPIVQPIQEQKKKNNKPANRVSYKDIF